MAIKKFCEKIILIIVTISILLSFTATPIANAGLGLKEGEFYYSGTTKGTYVASEGIFAWLIDNLGKIADWLLGLITMGIRMVFVGWTALIEKLLTWSLETTSGMHTGGGLMVDSTDVTAIGDSSGNITVQAIVYNQVPLFDINFFKLETDKTVSGTGQILKCKTCGRTCEDCCEITGTEGNYTGTCKNITSDRECGCSGCDSCEAYLANWNVEKPLVIQIREFVAMWYTIIRLLSMIAMLIVLIAIGLKMGLSTIASEKAVYKRMLIDWVVGMIILFAIHYLIFFIITINETLVNTVKETANSINKTQIQFVNAGKKASDGTQEVTDDEIEISLYEEIRTRAYDARLSVGLSGMIMYITLIYFAIRYSIVYLKRYLTLIVLALMAPPLGVAYALQKALTGKSSSMKTWMTEFVMTVIIQIVHALIYAVFISTALALSLQSVAGMIVALIFMNFALKTEKMFRQIFKMGDGDSLAGRMAESGDADKLKSQIDSAAHLAVSAKPIANAMMNTPLAKGVKSVGKIGLAGAGGLITGGVALGSSAVNKIRGKDTSNSDGNDQTPEASGGDREPPENPPELGGDNGGPGGDLGGGEASAPSMEEEKEQQDLIAEGGSSLRTKAAEGILVMSNSKSTAEEKASAQKDMDNYLKYQMLMRSEDGEKKKPLDAKISSLGILGKHAKRAVNITNHYKASAGYGGKLSQGYRAIFGTKHYDKKTGKMVYDGNGYFSQFSAANLFGLSDKDKEFLKTEAMKPFNGAVFGTFGMMVGLGAFVANPGIGGAIFAAGAHKYNQGFRQPAGERAYKGRYGKAKFPAATVQSTQQQLLQKAYSEIASNQQILDSEMVNNVRNNHPDLYKAIMDDLKDGREYSGIKIDNGVIKFGKKFGRGLSNTASAATFVPRKLGEAAGLFKTAAFSDSMYVIDRYAIARDKKETQEFEKEAASVLKERHQDEMTAVVQKESEKILSDPEILEREFLEEISENQQTDETVDGAKSKLDEYIKKCDELGFTYDKKTKKLTRRKSIEATSFSLVGKDKANQIEKTIDVVIQDMYKISGEIDTSETGINETLKILNNRLRSEGLLNKKHSVEVLFKDRETARKIVKDKANVFNSQLKAVAEESSRERLDEAISRQNGFSDKEKKLIQQIVAESGIQGSDATQVMNKLSERMGMLNQGKKQPVHKGTHTTKADSRKERKDKIKAIDKFLKAAESIETPTEITAQQASKTAIEAITTSAEREQIKQRAVKKSKAKLKKVLQFMEETPDGSIAELMDSTEEKIKNAKRGMEINGEKFSQTEAEALQSLFNKMKEEVAFNEYTRNVLDQKDSQTTKKARADLYAEREKYLRLQREMLIERADTIIAQNRTYGVNESNVGKLISSGTSGFVDSLGDADIQNILNTNKGILKEETSSKAFSELSLTEKSKVKNRVTDYLDKKLVGIDELKITQQKVRNANRKATLSGKIDINSQLNKLL